MSYLEQLLSSLTKDEIRTLQQLRISQSERRFLRETLRFIGGESSKNTPAVAQTSADYLYKLRSVLLQKLLVHFAGNDDLKILFFLKEKNLEALLLRQAKVAEKRTGASLTGKDKEFFYRYLFHVILPPFEHEYDSALITEYANKYAAARVTPLEDEALFLEAHLLYYRSLTTRYTSERSQRIQELFHFRERLQDSANIEARYIVLRTLIMLFRSGNSSELQQAIELTYEMLALIKSEPYYFGSKALVNNTLVVAELEMLQGNMEEAYQIYSSGFQASGGIRYSENQYQFVRFFFCHLYTGRFEQVYSLFFSDASESRILKFLSYVDEQFCLIAYYLLQHQVERALSVIRLSLQQINEESISTSNELYIRGFEICATILQGDYSFAEVLIRRHQKFVEYHSKALYNSALPSLFRLLHPIIEDLKGIRPLRASHIKKIESFRSSTEYYLVYSFYLLLQMIRSKDTLIMAEPISQLVA